MATFSERLRSLRKEKGFNQTELAKELNVTIGTVSVWERGVRKPEIETLEKISDYFGVSLGYLLGSAEDRKPAKGMEAGIWLPENDHDTMLKYMIMFSQLSDESKEAVKTVISTLYRADRERELLVKPDGEIDLKLKELLMFQ